METNRSNTRKRNFIITAALLLFIALYLAFFIWMNAGKRCFYLAGCVWERRDLNYLLLLILWIMQIIDRIRAIRKTEDTELRKRHVRLCLLFGFTAGLMLLVLAMTAVFNFQQRGNTCYADLNVTEDRSLLLAENKKDMRITVYGKKGCILRTLDSIPAFQYVHTNMVADGHYVWRTAGDSVTVQFDTGSTQEDTDVPLILERQYTP